ncbi:hypothetical protein B7463_g1544, partial [Scytalidium lignicola]
MARLPRAEVMKEAGATRPRLVAFASADCHTCLSGERKCQRQRPYCSTCLDNGIKCGGYVTALSWHQSRNHNRQRYQQTNGQVLLSSRRHKRADRRWNVEKLGNIHNWRLTESQKSTERDQTTSIHPQFPNSPSAYDPANLIDNHYSPDSSGGSLSTPGADTNCLVEDFAGQGQNDIRDFSFIPGVQPTRSSPHRVQDLADEQYLTQSHQEEVAPLDISACGVEASSLIAFDPTFDPTYPTLGRLRMSSDDMHLMPNSLSNVILIPPSFEPGQQREMLLKYYDTDLCVLPLTSDLALNPFRIRGFEPETSQLLLHSIWALSSQHQVNLGIGQTLEALEHRSRASELLARALQNRDRENGHNSVLAAILILMTLDCTISASGNWSDHLGKAAAVLETWGGTAALESPRIRSQVSMLVWWDATLALISRQGATFPSSYFEYLVENEEQDGWSFYDLTGCPTELLILLMRLVEMARQKELATSMEYLTFAMEPVLDVEQKLLSWNNIFADNSDMTSTTSSEGDEEEYCQQQDRYHLAEAWRYSLLLYIQRVFKWDRQSHRRPSAILRLICSILEHTRNCRKTSQAQKQLLLPIFLAGAEARDENMRDTARSFCLWWGTRSRYGMFHSVSNLLEEYWTEPHYKNGKPTWWGSFLDEKSISRRAGDRTMQFLFG